MADEEHGDDGLPKGAQIMNVVSIVEYMDVDGVIWKEDFSYDNADEQIDLGKLLELCEWAKMYRQAPILAELIERFREDTGQ